MALRVQDILAQYFVMGKQLELHSMAAGNMGTAKSRLRIQFDVRAKVVNDYGYSVAVLEFYVLHCRAKDSG